MSPWAQESPPPLCANMPSCATWTTCAAGTDVTNAPTDTLNRACAGCFTGTFSTTTDAVSCALWTSCVTGAFPSNTPSASVNQACTDCSGITRCVSGMSCSDASGQTCGTCADGYVPGQSGAVCEPPWPRQFGSFATETGTSVAVHTDGAVYATGYTNASVGGPTAGGVDAFLIKYDMNGTRQWTW